jgi:hypothetical protein
MAMLANSPIEQALRQQSLQALPTWEFGESLSVSVFQAHIRFFLFRFQNP